ncbi:hypothetical protein ES708_18839 [subsurface metagenome]
MRVAWICHFSNQKIRKRLGVEKGIDFAPWISLSIEEFENRQDIELHVVAPHRGLRINKYFQDKNIHYHFIRTGLPFIKRNWPRFFMFDYWTKYIFYSKSIEKTVRRIHPAIINLHGAENPYYSASILRLIDFPILVNVQGIFSLNILNKTHITKYEQFRYNLENEIYCRLINFGIRADSMKEYILNQNPIAKFFWQNYPIKNTFLFKLHNTKKIYDIVFFARVTKEKGIEDLIKAVSILKQDKSDVKLCVIGPGDKKYFMHLENLITESRLENNVFITGALETQELVHYEASKAIISVLPTYNDTIPGTIIKVCF